MSITLPLDSTACAQADDVFYCLHADDPTLFDASGQRIPLSADDPDQQHLREQWCDLYEDIVAHRTDGSRPFPACAVPGHRHHEADCPHCLHPGVGDDVSTDPVEGDPVDPVQGCPCQEEGRPTVRLRVSMFFDGTGNNRDNVTTGGHAYESYEAGYSNIARLESAGVRKAPALTRHITVYTEGIGTTSGGADDTQGAALGTGPTGVLAKVEAGRDAALAEIRAAADEAGSQVIEYLHVDAFGFSRGATAARHFVHSACVEPSTLLQTALVMAGYEVGEVVVKFVGLFDTVASYGAYHLNDTAELHLDAIKVAERVVQIAAAEEHRATFRLTNIRSAGSRGTEIFLPGVHSDIGGGYADGADEVDVQLFDIDFYSWSPLEAALKIPTYYREKQWMIDTGWYREDQLSEDWQWQLWGNRRNLSNKYSHIPLHMMASHARQWGVDFTSAVEGRHPVPVELAGIHSTLLAAAGSGQCSSASAWFGKDPALDPPWHKWLRNTYLHFSALYGLAAKQGTQRPNFYPPHPVYGKRVRGVNDG